MRLLTVTFVCTRTIMSPYFSVTLRSSPSSESNPLPPLPPPPPSTVTKSSPSVPSPPRALPTAPTSSAPPLCQGPYPHAKFSPLPSSIHAFPLALSAKTLPTSPHHVGADDAVPPPRNCRMGSEYASREPVMLWLRGDEG